jgi:hypothetical protein
MNRGTDEMDFTRIFVSTPSRGQPGVVLRRPRPFGDGT